jgi:penicillin-binding protein 1B
MPSQPGSPQPQQSPAQQSLPQQPQPLNNAEPNPPKKKNLFEKIFGGGGDKNKQAQPASPPQ